MDGVSSDLDVRGKVCVLTGASGGIGFETGVALARAGGRMALVCRSQAKADATASRLEDRVPGANARSFACDLASQRQLRRLGEDLGRAFPRIDALIHNAAAVYTRRELSEDGVEMQLAINHLAPFLLTALLRDRLMAAPAGRVVTVTSRAHARGVLRLDDLNLEKGYTAFRAYDRSKLANVLFTYELARRLAGTRVTANCIQPGLVRTDIGYKHSGAAARLLWWAMTRLAPGPERPAAGVARLAGAADLAGTTGCYFSGGQPARSSKSSRDEDLARALWQRSEALVGLAGEA